MMSGAPRVGLEALVLDCLEPLRPGVDAFAPLENPLTPDHFYANEAAETRQEAERAMAFAGAELERRGLRLHPLKSRVVRAGKGVVFLGQPFPEPPAEPK